MGADVDRAGDELRKTPVKVMIFHSGGERCLLPGDALQVSCGNSLSSVPETLSLLILLFEICQRCEKFRQFKK